MPYRKGDKKLRDEALRKLFERLAAAAEEALKIQGNDTEENRDFTQRLKGMAEK